MKVAGRILLWLLALLALGYAVFCAMVTHNAETMLYPSPARERARDRLPPRGAESWWRTMPTGERVEAWWRPAPGATAAHPAPAVIYFHGNAELIDDQRQTVMIWHGLGVSVLLCEHVGYGRSEGSPSLAADIANAAAWFDVLAQRPEVRAGGILTHGFSLGGALAAQLAERRPVAGVVLESTFSSLPSMARRHGILLYVGGERMDSAGVLRGLDIAVPVLITHGVNDSVIPVEEGRRLAAARPTARYDEAAYPHIPWAQDEPGQVMLRELLAKALARSGGAPPRG